MKPLIIGLHNPLSPRPGDALVPWPGQCTGRRLLELLQMAKPHFTEDDYLDAFDRLNLWPGMELPSGPGSSDRLATEGRRLLALCTRQPRNVVLLGARVWSAVLDRSHPELFAVAELGGSTFYHLPHPSGLNRVYNRPEHRERAAIVLASALLPATQEKRRA